MVHTMNSGHMHYIGQLNSDLKARLNTRLVTLGFVFPCDMWTHHTHFCQDHFFLKNFFQLSGMILFHGYSDTLLLIISHCCFPFSPPPTSLAASDIQWVWWVEWMGERWKERCAFRLPLPLSSLGTQLKSVTWFTVQIICIHTLLSSKLCSLTILCLCL